MTTSETQGTYDRRREHVKSTLSLAVLPVLTEGLGLLVDGVKNLRADLEAERVARAECAPIERQIRMAELKARLEELEFESDERQADRDERQEDREARQEERYLGKLQRARSLKQFMERGDDDTNLEDYHSSALKGSALRKSHGPVNGVTRFTKDTPLK